MSRPARVAAALALSAGMALACAGARAANPECPGVTGSDVKNLLDDVRLDNVAAADSDAAGAAQLVYRLLKADLLSMRPAVDTLIAARVLACPGREPVGAEADFDQTRRVILDERNVLLEVWAEVGDGGDEGGKRMLDIELHVAALPLCNLASVEIARRGFFDRVLSVPADGDLERLRQEMRSRPLLQGCASLGRAVQAMKNRDFDGAMRHLNRASCLLGSAGGAREAEVLQRVRDAISAEMQRSTGASVTDRILGGRAGVCP